MHGIETAFIARVGTDTIEVKTSQAGKPWASSSACVGDGEDDQWLRVADFRDRAQQLAGHLHKGDKIYAEGRLKLDTWTGKDGKERTGLNVAAWRVEQLGQIGKNKRANPKAPPEGEQPAPPTTVIRVRLVASCGTKRTPELDDLEFSGATYD
jgi:single-stranded DNA-binding protein